MSLPEFPGYSGWCGIHPYSIVTGTRVSGQVSTAFFPYSAFGYLRWRPRRQVNFSPPFLLALGLCGEHVNHHFPRSFKQACLCSPFTCLPVVSGIFVDLDRVILPPSHRLEVSSFRVGKTVICPFTDCDLPLSIFFFS